MWVKFVCRGRRGMKCLWGVGGEVFVLIGEGLSLCMEGGGGIVWVFF